MSNAQPLPTIYQSQDFCEWVSDWQALALSMMRLLFSLPI
ncbi:hypothetical protein FDUTEX481_04097 [Tolypothrix sp. PCC 7601]|nr:hypothetical protein FDUTEX481_04097 [Tolypothrix sp. PCC 7601]